jgi:hypothetical protein
MSILNITLIALWINPILGYFIIWKSNKSDPFKNSLLRFFGVFSFILVLAFTTGISFTSINADFIFLSFFHLGICVGVWAILARSNKYLLYLGRFIAFFIFGINYLTCSIGSLGLGFGLQNFECINKIELTKNLIYKEYSLGNGLTDYRGVRIEIYKKLTPLPLERKVQEDIVHIAEYSGYTHEIDIQYDSEKRYLYIQGTDRFVNSEYKFWNNTIKIIE